VTARQTCDRDEESREKKGLRKKMGMMRGSRRGDEQR